MKLRSLAVLATVSAPALLLTIPALAQDFGPATSVNQGGLGSPWCVEAADVDLDGDPDLVVAARLDGAVLWYPNDGLGSFGAGVVIDTAAPGAVDLHAADLDGDGDPDLVTAQFDGDVVTVHMNLGGTFAPPQSLSGALDGARSVHAADLDGDGDTDIIAGSSNDDTVAWFENLGSGAFGAAQVISSGADFVLCVHAGDMDGDGDQDVLAASRDDDRVRVFENLDGLGGSWQPHTAVILDGPTFVRAADLDGDGDLDVATTAIRANSVRWTANQGAGMSFGTTYVLSNGLDRASGISVADLDQDGTPDLIACGYGSDPNLGLPPNGTILWFRGLGAGSFGLERVITDDLDRAAFVRAVDLNADGMPEVASAAWQGGEVVTFTNLMTRPDVIVRPGESIQAAIDAAEAGDVILVDPGTYPESLDLRGKQLELRSTGGPERTTIDGTGTGTSVLIAGGTPSGTLVSGFALTGGAGRPDPSGAGVDHNGGAVWVGDQGQLTLVDCLLVQNGQGTATLGGGIYADGIGTHAVLRRCIVTGNRASSFGGAALCDGGSTMLLEQCTIYGNFNDNPLGQQGGVSLARGGGAVVTHSIVWGNDGAQLGAAAPPENLGTRMDVDFSDIEGGYAGPSNNILLGAAGPGIIDADPMFSFPVLLDFSLSPGSPCIDAGSVSFPGDCDGTIADLGAAGPACLGIGTSYCSPAVPNSTGLPGRTLALGSPVFAANDMTLQASSLPPGSFGYFIGSELPGIPSVAGGSSGRLCLGGFIGRFIGPNQVLPADPGGVIALPIDLTGLPTALGTTSASPGDTWYFQLWHRDGVAGTVTSNFTDAVAVTFL